MVDFDKQKFDLYIGMMVYVLFGLFLQKFRIAKSSLLNIVCTINRFEYKWKNVLYNKVNSYACKKLMKYDISPRMEKGRKQ